MCVITGTKKKISVVKPAKHRYCYWHVISQTCLGSGDAGDNRQRDETHLVRSQAVKKKSSIDDSDSQVLCASRMQKQSIPLALV